MASKTKTAVNSMAKLEKLRKSFEEQAKTLGLLDDYLFVTQYRNFQKSLHCIEELDMDLQKRGMVVPTTDSKGNPKDVINPSSTEMKKHIDSAQKAADQLARMIEASARMADDDDEL